MKLFSSRGPNLVPVRIRSRDRGAKTNLIIHHYCPHTFNAGDHFVIRSIRKHLQKHLPEAVFVPKPVADNRGWGAPIGLRGENIRFSNEFADAVILGGSDQYHNWAPRIVPEEIRELVPPLFFVGLGVSSRDLGEPPYIKKQEYLEHILAANLHTAMSSVRDEATARFLSDLGFDRAVVTGCPALYLFDSELRPPAGDGPVLLTFPYPLAASAEHKFTVLIDAVRHLARRLAEAGERFVVVCHDDRDVPPAMEMFGRHRIFFSNYVEDYFPLYQSARYVVGSRLHATILSLGMGVPAVNVNLDVRGTGFSDTFGLTHWSLDYTEDRLEEKIWERCRALGAGDLSGFAGFREQRDRHRPVFDRFMKEMAEAIRKGP